MDRRVGSTGNQTLQIKKRDVGNTTTLLRLPPTRLQPVLPQDSASSLAMQSAAHTAASPFASRLALGPCRRPSHKRALITTAASADAPHIAIVGGGWGGWGAAKALCEAASLDAPVRVTLVDALPDPTGATVPTTASGKPIEAGFRGFWRDYPNIFSLVDAPDDVFTPYLPSAFYSPDGLEATAPVFADATLTLPSPMGQVLATFDNFKRLPLQDRATMAGLLLAMLDYDRDEATRAAYDRMSAHELCIRCGMSKRLVDDFVRPTLAVGLFTPLEQTSALVCLELLYFYALAHQDSFDVRWIKGQTVGKQIIAPLVAKLQQRRDTGAVLNVLGGSRVSGLHTDGRRITGLTYVDGRSGETHNLDGLSGVVLAVGSTGMRTIVRGSDAALAITCPELTAAASLPATDVMTVRLWLDRRVDVPYPANVFARYPELRGAGGTFFDLSAASMQGGTQDALRALWAAAPDTDARTLGTVIACDFYGSTQLSMLCDTDLVDMITTRLLPSCVPAFAGVHVLEHNVMRFPSAVSWFTPGSFTLRPPLQTRLPNLVCAGDWVRLGDREHGAKGLCQERAYVAGLEAGNALLRAGVAGPAVATRQHAVLPIRPDEPQVMAGRAAAKAAADLAMSLGLQPSPWVR